MANRVTETTPNPPAQLAPKGRKRLNADEWTELENNVCQALDAAIAARQDVNRNLDDWNDSYELRTEESDFPFVGASNVVPPLIPTQLDTMHATVIAKVHVPNLIMVTGNTSSAAVSAHLVERWLNNEFTRLRGESSWLQLASRWFQLSLRDGVSYMEATWKYRKSTVKLKERTMRMEPPPVQEPPDPSVPADPNAPPPQPPPPMPVLDEKGHPIYDTSVKEVEDIFNDVDMRPLSRRNVVKIPAFASSVNNAVAVAVIEYMYEQELDELVREGILDADAVERALSYTPSGNSDISSSRMPTGSYEVGGQVALDPAQGTQNGKMFKNRGPVEIYRYHTRQYDLDNDGTCEENLAWVHYQSNTMIGWCAYEYLVNLNGVHTIIRPLIPVAGLERPGTDEGFAIPERLAGTINELKAQRKQRLDEGTIRASPPFWQDINAKVETQGGWAPNGKILSEKFEDVRRYELPPLEQQMFIDEELLHKDANDFTGLSAIAQGQQSSGRRSATEARQRGAATNVRVELVALQYRLALRMLVNFIFELKKSFLTEDQHFTVDKEHFTLPLEVLRQDYSIDIAGTSDPLDAGTRRQETLQAYEIISQSPIVQQDPMKQYRLLRRLVSTFDWADMDQIIGTEQETMQRIQTQMQADQAKAEMLHLADAVGRSGAAAQQAQQGAPQGGPPQGAPPQPAAPSPPMPGASQ